MSMFDSYDMLNPEYIPNNSLDKLTNEISSLDCELPRIAHNIKGTAVGLTWSHGEMFEHVFSVDKKIHVAEDSIVYEVHGLFPDEKTVGVEGQQAYNTVDCKSWTCVGEGGGFYIWIVDDSILFTSNGSKEIVIDYANTDVLVSAKVYNFRWELIHSVIAENSTEVVLSVDEEFNQKVKAGTYYCIVEKTTEGKTSVDSKIQLIIT